jgi:hypothetical protein
MYVLPFVKLMGLPALATNFPQVGHQYTGGQFPFGTTHIMLYGPWPGRLQIQPLGMASGKYQIPSPVQLVDCAKEIFDSALCTNSSVRSVREIFLITMTS